MTCKIKRVLTPGGFVVFRVIGRIDCAYVEVLQELIETEKTAKGGLALDLKEVTVVKPSGRLPLRRTTESNFETARPTYANELGVRGNPLVWISTQHSFLCSLVDWFGHFINSMS